MEKQDESAQFAYTNPQMFEKLFIPSQHVKNKEKEVFIIEYEGVTIEVIGTANIDEPLLLYLNGELKSQINKNGRIDLEFKTETELHKINVWNGRAKNFFFSNFIFHEGIAITIDGIPVKNTLSDPLKILKEGKIGVYIFLGLLTLGAILIPIIQVSRGIENATIALSVYIVLVLLLVFAIVIYNKTPKTALWIGLLIGSIETIDFIYSFFAMQGKNFFMFLFMGSVRTGSLYAMYRSLKAIKTILNIPVNKLVPNRKDKQNEIKEQRPNNNTEESAEVVAKTRIDRNSDLNNKEIRNNEVEEHKSKINFKSFKELISVSISVIVFYIIWVTLSITLLSTNRLYKPIYDLPLLLLLPLILIVLYRALKMIYKNYNKGSIRTLSENRFFNVVNVFIVLILLGGTIISSFYLYKHLKSKLYYENAINLIEASEIVKAKSLLKELTEFNVDYEEAYFSLAQLYEKEFYENKKIADNLGIANYGDVSFYTVILHFRKVIKLNPENNAARKHLADICEFAAQNYNENYFYSEAIYEYKTLIKQKAESIEVYTQLARAYLNRFIQDPQIYPASYLEEMIGILYDGEKANNLLQPRAYELLGWAYYFINNFRNAIDSWEKSIRVGGKLKDADSYYYLGISYYKIGDKEKEIENYRISASLGYEEAIQWFKKWGLSYLDVDHKNHYEYSIPPWEKFNDDAVNSKNQDEYPLKSLGNYKNAYLHSRREFWDYLRKIYHPEQIGYDFKDFIKKANDDSFVQLWYNILRFRDKIDLSLSEFKYIMRIQ